MQDLVLRRGMIEQGEVPAEIKRVERAEAGCAAGRVRNRHLPPPGLLAHFGEVLAQPCGNCDNLPEPPLKPGTARWRRKRRSPPPGAPGQRFGAGHLIDILLGVRTEKIERFGHDKLPTFGVGTELDRKSWGAVFRQLVARGALEVDHESYGALCLTEFGDALLRGREKIFFRQEHAGKNARAVLNKKAERMALAPADEALFEKLRAERARLAKEQKLPAYVIFHDTTLAAIATARPTDRQALGQLPGLGTTKLERYGDAILAIVTDAGGGA